MAKVKTNKKSNSKQELDSVYILKLVLYIVLGAQWVRLASSSSSSQIPIPAGLIIGIIFAFHDHFRIDRKIEYAILLVAALVGFWAQVGVFITT